MTGTVPYYGGRLSPSQAYAVSHQSELSRDGASATPAAEAGYLTATLATLQQLLDDGVLTTDEYDRLRDRVLQ
jgi:hypothetical protein